jgi:hypothetical protein
LLAVNLFLICSVSLGLLTADDPTAMVIKLVAIFFFFFFFFCVDVLTAILIHMFIITYALVVRLPAFARRLKLCVLAALKMSVRCGDTLETRRFNWRCVFVRRWLRSTLSE